MNSTPIYTLLRAHFLVLYLNHHSRKEHLLNECCRGHTVQYNITYKFPAAWGWGPTSLLWKIITSESRVEHGALWARPE